MYTHIKPCTRTYGSYAELHSAKTGLSAEVSSSLAAVMYVYLSFCLDVSKVLRSVHDTCLLY
jgi:hypothetical protein